MLQPRGVRSKVAASRPRTALSVPSSDSANGSADVSIRSRTWTDVSSLLIVFGVLVYVAVFSGYMLGYPLWPGQLWDGPPPYNGTVIIGMSGGSGSGKTTVALALAKYFNGDVQYNDVLHLDVAIRTPKYVETNNPKHLTEKPGFRINQVEMFDETVGILNHSTPAERRPRVLILEGTPLYADHRLMQLMHIKTFVIVSRETCFQRRVKRDFNGEEIAQFRQVHSNVFWPWYEKHYSDYANNRSADVIGVDGEPAKEVVFREALRVIEPLVLEIEASAIRKQC